MAKFLTKENLKNLPKLDEIDKMAEAEELTVQVKHFLTGTAWTWFAVAYDPESDVFFGYTVSGLDPDYSEWGYYSGAELRSVKNHFGLGVERDMYFTPKKFKEIPKSELEW